MILGRKKSKVAEPPYSFQERFHSIQRIAIIYPQRAEWLRIARYTLQNLYRLPDRFEFLILLPGHAERPEIEHPHEYDEMNYEPDSQAFTALRSRLTSFNPDLLLQLEPEPSQKLEKAINGFEVALKIGFGSEHSGLNVLYSQKRSGFYEKNLLNLISLLRLEV